MSADFLRSGLSAALLAALIPASSESAAAQTLHPLPPASAGQPLRLESRPVPGTEPPSQLLRLEASPDPGAGGWMETGRFHDALFPWADGGAGAAQRRFYRLRLSKRTAQDDWKNQLVFPEDSFRSRELEGGTVRWVKFALRTDEPWRVYFQDSVRWPFHYEFATARLSPFMGMTRPEFDAVSLRRAGQRVVLGAVLFPPRPSFREYGVQLTGLDAYTPAEVGQWFAAVKNAVHAGSGAEALYMPVFEQSAAARRDAEALAALGVTVASVDRWLLPHHIYSSGWALGRLKFFPAAEITAAFADGRLLPTDILLTDGVPAETPPVAGILSLEPATPNSHTAILAQSFGIPFVHLPDAVDQARARALDGRKVILRAMIQYSTGTVRLLDVQETLPAEVEAELLALKAPHPILYPSKQKRGAISAAVSGLQAEDIRFFGGKAANYGLLRRTIPGNCPDGIAFSFDLWDAFMDQPLPASARTLRQEIAARLAEHSTWPPRMSALQTTLTGIRDLIRRTAVFPDNLRQPVLDSLAGFTPARKIRFRSSTNVEDGETFTGAGLYDSYSGCLLDDLDGDATGPCLCETGEPEERGVFRAIQRVYASFYNDNAYLERLRHGVTESESAMGVLAHHSFPDGEELANGVAALEYRYTFSQTVSGSMVTQAGAESVTNPAGGSLPEVVDVFRYGNTTSLSPKQGSSRVPLGAQVMTWEQDYKGFSDLFKTVGDAWLQRRPERTTFSLDFEYKKDLNLGLIVKQVREIPAAPTGSTVPWLIEEPVTLQIAQMESGDVFANHRLKSLWALRTANGRMTPAFLAAGLYQTGSLEHVENSTRQALAGPLSQWPGATITPPGTVRSWTTGSGAGQRRWNLQTTVTSSVTGGTPPVFTAADFPITITVEHASPQPVTDYNGDFGTTTQDFARLEPPRPVTPGSIPVERLLENGKGVTVRTRFLWPDEPPTAGGYTAPLVKFESTVITGLTSIPITLTGYWSQTYRPGHHNFTEDFIFEPALEPGMDVGILEELLAAGIQYIHVRAGFTEPDFNVVSPEGKLRRL
ncbi:MAG: uncharacterized protein JWM59_372 [Verrucomicrobiales bacterium]|nr:uncharacterized protein [Verrucomicrobiales bacterium]